MWLGFSAAFIGILYATVKFVTVFHLRRLREEALQVQHDAQRAAQRLELLQEKLGVEQSRQRTMERDAAETRRQVQQLHARLQALLPPAMQPQLERCQALQAEASTAELKLLLELELVEEISKALVPLSLLVLTVPQGTPEAPSAEAGQLIERLNDAGVHFRGPQNGQVFCYFPQPGQALDLLSGFFAALPGDRLAGFRGGLHAGVELTDEQSDIKRLLARSLQRARRLLEQAPEASVLMNDEAHQGLSGRNDVAPFEADGGLFVWSWRQPEGGAT